MRGKGRFLATLVLATAAVLPALGASSPIPSALANGDAWVQFGSNLNSFQYLIGPYNAGYGGGFQPTVSPVDSKGDALPTSPLSTLTTVWCVDYQLDVNFGSAYEANITTLNNITTPDANVRYGTLDSVGDPGWTNTLTVAGFDPNSDQIRYTMAAALVSQYENSNGVTDPTQPANNSVNQAIQEATWYVTYNSEYGATNWSDTGIAPASCTGSMNSSNDPSNYMCWVKWAEQDSTLENVNTSAWAVISGPVIAGTNTLNAPQSNQYQTFLVQVQTADPGHLTPNPEPTFYGVLAIGLGGLLAAARRRTWSQQKVKGVPSEGAIVLS